MLSDVGYRMIDEQGAFFMFVKDKRNNIKASRVIHIASSDLANTDQISGLYRPLPALKYPLYPGDSVFFANNTANNASLRIVHAIVTLTRF